MKAIVRRALALLAATALLLAAALTACTYYSQAPEPPHKLGRSPFVFEQASLTGPDASASTVLGTGFGGFDRFDDINIDCQITTGTGDASVPLDVYMQKLVATSPNVWVDFIHFPKQSVTLTSAKVTYNAANDEYDPNPLLVGVGADDAGGMALDAGIIAHGHPGSTLRLVVVTGAGVIYTPASVACYFSGRVRGI